MRPTLAVVLALVFVALLAIDPLVCADGCRDDGGKIAPAATTYCAICPGLGPVASRFAVTPVESSLPSVTSTKLWPEQLFAHLIEHLPRHTWLFVSALLHGISDR